METLFIYALKDPRDGRVRYIGQAQNPRRRLIRHKNAAKGNSTHVQRWISSLRNCGTSPAMEIIDEVPVFRRSFFERAYIKVYREAGADLTNGTDGGEGAFNPSMETRSKMSAARLGKKLTPQHRANISAAKKGVPKSAETRAKLRAANLGKTPSAETRAKIGAAHRGKVNSPETRARMSASQTGRKFSSEHRATLSAVHAGVKLSAEHRAAQSAGQKARREREKNVLQ